MRAVAGWAVSFLIGLAALIGLIAFLNSRDQSGVNQDDAVSSGPGQLYRGRPALSPALRSLLSRGNVIVLYRDRQPPAGTNQLVPPGGNALAQAGQAVVVQREPSLAAPLVAVSTKKFEQADTPQQLQPFVDYWLGGG
jgi:hypothetical protein